MTPICVCFPSAGSSSYQVVNGPSPKGEEGLRHDREPEGVHLRRGRNDLATDSKLVDLNATIETQTLGRFQIGFAAILIVCMFVDGFEAQAPGFAAPFIIRDFNIPRSAMGLVFGAGNLGLMLGAVLLGILGDRSGRKLTIIIGCAVLALFSFLKCTRPISTRCDLAHRFGHQGSAVLPSVIALGTEFSPAIRRPRSGCS